MSTLRITIAGHEYEVACDDGQESHLKHLARLLDERVRQLGGAQSKIDHAQLLMLAALTLTDELQDANRETGQLRHDLLNSSQSFEKNKQMELEKVVASTIHDIANRIEAIAGQLERV